MVNNHGDRKSPIPGVVGPLPNDLFMAYKWGNFQVLLGMVPLGKRDPYHSHSWKFMGSLWEPYGKGVPFLGAPGNSLDLRVFFLGKIPSLKRTATAPEKMLGPKRKRESLPTMNFQGLC